MFPKLDVSDPQLGAAWPWGRPRQLCSTPQTSTPPPPYILTTRWERSSGGITLPQRVGLALLLEVSTAQLAEQPSPEAEARHLALLARLAVLQPSLPHTWHLLADHYGARSSPCRRREAACVLRARALLASMLASQGGRDSFLTDRNRRLLEMLGRRLEQLEKQGQDLGGLEERVCKDIRGGQRVEEDKEEEEEGDFQDLGSSVRLKQIEEALENQSDIKIGELDDLSLIAKFEQNWF